MLHKVTIMDNNNTVHEHYVLLTVRRRNEFIVDEEARIYGDGLVASGDWNCHYLAHDCTAQRECSYYGPVGASHSDCGFGT